MTTARCRPPRALEITQSVLGALAHSHDAGIIHRDIKPANVMLTPTDQVKVMDFGIARVIDDTSSLTQTAAVIGTAQYLSPEQASGKRLDLRSDLYSVGCLLFELLVGRPPFVGETSVSVAYQHVREAPLAPSQLNPAVSPELDAVVLKALAKNPDDRYQSATEMAADLGRLLAGSAPDAGIAGPAALGAAAAAATAVADPTQTMPLAAGPPPAARGFHGHPRGAAAIGRRPGHPDHPFGPAAARPRRLCALSAALPRRADRRRRRGTQRHRQHPRRSGDGAARRQSHPRVQERTRR